MFFKLSFTWNIVPMILSWNLESSLNDGVAEFARLFQGSSKPPVKRRWDGSYPYTSYPHLCIGGTTLAYFHSSGTTAEEIERFIMAVSGAEMLEAASFNIRAGIPSSPVPFDVLSNLS